MAKKPLSLDDIGRASPDAFFVQHGGKSKKNPHYVPASKRKPAPVKKKHAYPVAAHKR